MNWETEIPIPLIDWGQYLSPLQRRMKYLSGKKTSLFHIYKNYFSLITENTDHSLAKNKTKVTEQINFL